MDILDSQDNRRSDLQFVEITEKIIGCAFEVINELGTRFLESVYEKALAIALQEEGFHVQLVCNKHLAASLRDAEKSAPEI